MSRLKVLSIRELLKCFTFIRVSLDAATPEEYVTEKGKDCFKNVIENIRYIKENSESVVLGVSYVLNNRNYWIRERKECHM